MLGPQILVAMLLIARKDAVRSSLIYIISVIVTLVTTTYLYYVIGAGLNLHHLSISGRPIFKYVIVAILVFILIRTIIKRKKLTREPKWMADLSDCSLKRIALIGFMLIALMPADIAMEFTVGNLINSNEGEFRDAVPFFLSVLVIASLPLIAYLIFWEKRPEIMQKVNNWLNTHGYLINVIILSLFIYLTLS